jgi:UDP-N-acetyl-D-mannosaminuronic acid dehydrogenase
MVSDSELKVAVLGLGYIGLPTAAVIARTGAKVLGIDVDARWSKPSIRAASISRRSISTASSRAWFARGNLRAATQIEPANIFVIAVPTPFGENHAPNIGYVLKAATNIATVLKAGDVVILESTSPVGTTDKVAELLSQLRPRPQGARPLPGQRRRRGRLLPRARAARAHPRRVDRQ